MFSTRAQNFFSMCKIIIKGDWYAFYRETVYYTTHIYTYTQRVTSYVYYTRPHANSDIYTTNTKSSIGARKEVLADKVTDPTLVDVHVAGKQREETTKVDAHGHESGERQLVQGARVAEGALQEVGIVAHRRESVSFPVVS